MQRSIRFGYGNVFHKTVFARCILMSLIFLMGISGLKAQLSLTNGTPSASIDFTNNMQTSVGSNPSQPFAGSGFEANTVTAGRLNSNAWSFTGWSDGALNYGGTRTTGDYARGATAAAVTTGGVYASRVAPATAADPRMMFQPGGSDFAPGTVTLRLQNNGTTIISQLALSYNLFVRNDQGRASSFNFSWSADDVTYTDVAALDYTTIEVADALGWVQVGTSPSRSTTLTGLNFTPGSYFYIRWTCEDVSGSGSRDEIGLDDISVTATYDAPCTQPGAPQATVNSFANTNAYQTDVTFTRGVGTGGVLIVASTSATLSSDPVSGNTYTMNTNFGNGDPVGGGFVVYRGAANGASNAATITVTGLSPLTTYYFFAFEYNITVPCFKTPGNSNSVTTAAGSATLPSHYFRTVASGNWNNTSTWESSPDNATWNPATAKPTSASSGITIRNLHTVTITAPETGKLINIALGGTLTYNNTGAGGWDLDIASDGTAAHELIVNGTYLIYGIAPTLAVGATCQVTGSGIIRANGNAGAGTSDDFARSTQIFLVTNAVYDWNTTSTFSSSNTIYFPNAAASDIAIFRVSQTPSFSIGGANPTTFLGRFEANAAISFANSAVKVFRNGIIGTGNITQLAGSGQFQITGTAQLGGTGSITLNTGGMAITGTSSTTLISNKVIDAGTCTVEALGTLFTGVATPYSITGTSTFVLAATANLYIGSAQGITTTPSLSGNIQTSVRTFSSGANYYYYGNQNQATGNALPASLTAIFEIQNTGAVANNTVTLTNNNTTSTTFNLRRGLFAAGTGQQLNIIAGGTVNWQSPGGAQTTAATAGVINFNGAGTIVPNVGLQLTNVTINTGAVIMGGANTTINGIFEIKGGNVSPGTAPTYASSPASTLSYNCSCNYGAYEEWYPNTFGTSAGVPHHVNIAAGSSLNFGSGTFPHEMRGDLTISATSTFALSSGIGGDLYIKGNWIKAAGGTFTNNARAVKFNGTGSNQTITITGGGTETFGYFQVNKGAGETVILAGAPNATNVTINGGLGGNTLELQSGDLDLNGRTVNFANFFNSNQNNIGIDGTLGNLTRNVISSSGTGVFTVFNNVVGTHNITIGRISANASLLSFGTSVILTTSGIAGGAGGINFGNTLTTINGTLQINNFGFVTGFAPTYAVNSNLVYNSTGLFDRNVEWGNTSGPGYPYNVTAQNTTNLRLNFPNLNGNANRAIAGTLTIANGSTVLLSTTDPSTLTIGRDLVINGTLTMPTVAGGDVYVGRNWNRSATGVFTDNDRAVFFNGSDNGTITANGGQYFPYIYLTKTALSNTVSLVDNISVGKEFSVTSGTFQLANRNATLLSTATNTASFGKVGATGDVAYSGTGRFIVERYLPTGTLGGQHTKTWQFLAVPTNGGQTINAAWQEGAAVANADPVSGYGTQITSNVAPLQPMFDALTTPASGPSMKTYNPAGAGSWVGVPNTTSTALYNAKGYMIFVRGDRSVFNFSGPNSTAVPTNLRSTGRLFVPGSNPPPSTTVLPGKFESIGNPYACAIDFLNITKPAAPAVDDVFYVWDPLLPGTWGLGAYQTISAANGYLPNPGGTANYSNAVPYTRIQSGQAFLVHSSGAGGTVSFTENAKIINNANNMVFRGSGLSAARQFLRIQLYTAAGDIADGAVVAFDQQFNNQYDANDAVKMANGGENLGIRHSNGKLLSIEARSLVQRTDTVFLDFSNLRKQTYQFRFGTQHIPINTMEILLIDRYLEQTQMISIGDSTFVNFTINAETASADPGRFILVFRNKVRNVSNAPLVESKSGQVISAEQEADVKIFPNPVQDGIIRMQFINKAEGEYQLKLVGSNGQVLRQQGITVSGIMTSIEMSAKGIAAGQYTLYINEPGGNKSSFQLFIQ